MILNIIIAVLICALIYYLRKTYIATLHILSTIKKINNKVVQNYDFVSNELSLSPIGSSYDNTLSDFTMPKMRDRLDMDNLDFIDESSSEEETL